MTLILTGSSMMQTLSVTADTVNSSAAQVAGGNLPTPVLSNTVSFDAGNAALTLIKTADRAAAEPGDTIIYRLSLRNIGNAIANNIVLTDILPLGLRFLPNSLQAELSDGTSNIKVSVNLPTQSTAQRTNTFTFASLPAKTTLTLVYAVVVTPDAIRGTGRNQAQETRSNIATYLVRIRSGILSDCGTIIGRVFVDKNFDGEQQPGEPGVPNAVIYMDDGNRITTDANGLFSLANVISGDRTGTLDLSSLPGYTLAPNKHFIERNSKSRLVRLAPGGMVKMNFAVTPKQ